MALIEKDTNDTNDLSPIMRLLPWVGLLLLGFVEAVVLTDARAGLVLHAVILLALITYRTYLARIPAGRNLCLALCLLPLMRMLSLGLPYALLPRDSWHFWVSVPMLIAVIIALRYMAWRDPDNPAEFDDDQPDIRVQPAALPALLLVGLGGFALGQIVFDSMKLLALKNLFPANLANSPETAWMALLSVTSGLALSALCEEIIFRSMIQTSAGQVIGGRASVLFTALLYAVMSLGNMSLNNLAPEFGLVFVIALIFGIIVYWSGSIVGASLLHIILNITAFVVLPSGMLGALSPWLMALSAGLGICGLAWLALRQNTATDF
jgi:membrane protease YdiL (CAAX protease family)